MTGRGKGGGDFERCGVVGSAGSVKAAGRMMGGRTRAGTGRGCSGLGVVVGRVIEPKRNHGRGS